MSDFEMLIEKYPELFRHLRYGVECNTGWYDLIEEACQKLSALELPDLFFSQIKEKFGGLRLYLSIYDDSAGKIAGAIEQRSYKVCEYCGDPGITRPYSYILTLCDACHEERVSSSI